jgi:hypothetical protein
MPASTTVFSPEIDLDRRYSSEYARQHPAAASLRGKARFRCKRCNSVFLRPSEETIGRVVEYRCPECGKWPRHSIDVPEPNPAKDARVGELVVLW